MAAGTARPDRPHKEEAAVPSKKFFSKRHRIEDETPDVFAVDHVAEWAREQQRQASERKS